MSKSISLSSSAPATVDVITAIALPARLPAWADDSVAPIGTMPVDASLTLRLVEHASASMARMEQQLETISVCGLDLLRQTRDERQRFQHEVQAALHAAETWKQHAMTPSGRGRPIFVAGNARPRWRRHANGPMRPRRAPVTWSSIFVRSIRLSDRGSWRSTSSASRPAA
jgi:hypothetical protein